MLQKELTKEVLLKRKDALDTVIKRRFIYQPAFAIYGGIAGLYDYGPVGCAIKNNIEQYWREHFIIEDDLFEIAATCLTPEVVLKASGHVDRFTDLLVTDSKTNQGYRADKIVTETLEKKLATDKKLTEEEKLEIEVILKNVDSYKEAQISEVIAKYKIVATETGNELTPPQPFNLMLPTSVGPSTKVSSFLRPETAQGMFLNFPRLLEQSGYKLPFGAAQIGLGFRNEIAPRGQLLRCREFQMAEIEYFVDPQDKTCKKFHKYRDLELPLLSKQNQKQLQDPEILKMGIALEKGIVGNETLAYMIIRTYLYLVEIGINKDNIRFRQHQDDEKAHYSQDCWDAEIETSSGWVECVGLADRAAYDLTAHSNATGQKLQAARKFKQPEQRSVVDIKLDKAKIGKELKKDGTVLMKHIESLSDEDRQELFDYFQTNESKEFQIEGLKIVLNKNLIQFEKKVVNVMEEKFVPHVIEPAFGIGRILQAVVEHSFRQRDDPQKTYFKFSPKIAPVKVSILPVIQTEEYDELIERITKSLKKQGISCKTDASGVTIGKKYARTDEIGIPFALTVYGDSLTQDIVTLRDIETTKQVTIKIDQVPNVIYQLSNNIIKWEDILKTYPIYEQQQE